MSSGSTDLRPRDFRRALGVFPRCTNALLPITTVSGESACPVDGAKILATVLGVLGVFPIFCTDLEDAIAFFLTTLLGNGLPLATTRAP